MIAPHVVAVSNLVRNTIVTNRLRAAAIGPKDLTVHTVTEALRSAGFEVESDLKAKVAGEKLELDVVARRDDTLILLECKNAYHPVSVHEKVPSSIAIKGEQGTGKSNSMTGCARPISI